MKPKSVTTQIRIPEELHVAIKQSAENDNISMNAEIIRRLAGGVNEQTLRDMAELRLLLDENGARYQEIETLLAKQNDVSEGLSKKNSEYKAILRDIVKDLIAYFESADRSADSERAMLLELVKLLSNMQD